MFSAVLVAAFLGVALGQNEDCRGVRDGTVVAWGCRSYTLCQGGRAVLIDCHKRGLVYNPVKKTCDHKLSTPPPCGLYRECTGKKDGMYADRHVNCTAFYSCRGGKFFGHQQCNPGLVFNEGTQTCDWPFNVPPPCGTKGGAPPQPTNVPMSESSNNIDKKRRRNSVRGRFRKARLHRHEEQSEESEEERERKRPLFRRKKIINKLKDSDDLKSKMVHFKKREFDDHDDNEGMNDVRSRFIQRRIKKNGSKSGGFKAPRKFSPLPPGKARMAAQTLEMIYKEFVHGFN